MSTEDWQPLAIDTDPATVIARGLDALQDSLGDAWTPREGMVEVALAEELGTEAAALAAAVQQQVDLVAALGFGVGVHRVPVLAGTRASLAATITVTAVGAAVPAGFTVTATTADGLDVAFTVPAALVATSLNQPVQLLARDVGAAGNGVPPGPLRVNNVAAAVVQVVATAASTGGSDPETLTGYLTRLRDYVATLSPGGVRADRLAPLLRSVPGVQRVLAIDLFDATIAGSDPVTKPAERTVTVYPLGADGQPVAADVAAAVTAQIAAVREVNFVVRVATPTYTAVSVNFTGTARPGNDPSVVRQAVIDALHAYLDPARWGGTARADGTPPTDWTDQRTVRYLDVVRAAGAVDALLSLSSITVNGGTADVQLPGPAALPSPTSTITGTVA